ncbi:DUF2796 domain-containing protein [Geoalkalibacter halelectricus]|uniref:DUF2796 domain-containing protein n=1 Tax=Geoalkalibacter halelectricus TaxID=2847045 RepID=UPI003D224722
MTRLLVFLLALIFVLPLTAAAHPTHGVHEHGVADLRVAVDGEDVLIEMESPLDNLVGFEHRPRTDAQRAALEEAMARLARFEQLFGLPAAAACAVKEHRLQSPWPTETAKHDHGHEKKSVHSHSHGHAHDDGHADVSLSYLLKCANPEALTELEVRWFEVFPRTERIRAESATPRGQGSVTLRKDHPRLPL